MLLKTIPITKNFIDFKKLSTLVKEAFPSKENLILSKFVEMAQNPDFDFLGLYDENLFVGFMAIKKYKKLNYLFFLAIDSVLRSSGYGSRAIKTLVDLYPNTIQIVDLEKLDETANNSIQRQKRRKFYLKNGYKPTNKYLRYLNTDYEILCMQDNFDFDAFKDMLKTIQLEGFNPEYFEL